MSEALAKATRREIRRAFGAEAVTAIMSRDSKINELDAHVRRLQHELASEQDARKWMRERLENRIAHLEKRRPWHREFWR